MLTAALNADPVKSGEAYDVPAISEGHQSNEGLEQIQRQMQKIR